LFIRQFGNRYKIVHDEYAVGKIELFKQFYR